VAASPAVIFEGGPVGLDGALGVGRIGDAPPVEGWTGVAGRVGLLDLERTPEELGGAVEQLRVFSGHAGWGAGQLDAEIAEGSWFVVDSEPGDPFTREPQRLWRDVLRRQPGRLAMFADYPVEPGVN
jgi:putative transcriptional regulator